MSKVDKLSKRRKREARKRYDEATKRHGARRKISGAMLSAINHPIRREAMRVLNGAARPISPTEISDLITWDLQSVSFHVRVLAARNLARCTHTRQVRGSTEHFYVSRVVKNDLLASILSGTKKDDKTLFEN